MNSITATIQFKVEGPDHINEMTLLPGTYTATVKQVAGEQLQYQICDFYHSGDDVKAEGENQLILISKNDLVTGEKIWSEAFHNTSNELTQTIGEAIEKAFQ